MAFLPANSFILAWLLIEYVRWLTASSLSKFKEKSLELIYLTNLTFISILLKPKTLHIQNKCTFSRIPMNEKKTTSTYCQKWHHSLFWTNNNVLSTVPVSSGGNLQRDYRVANWQNLFYKRPWKTSSFLMKFILNLYQKEVRK